MSPEGTALLEAVVAIMPQLRAALDQSPDSGRLGPHRANARSLCSETWALAGIDTEECAGAGMEAVRLLEAAMLAESPAVHTAFLEYGVLGVCLQLFLQFPTSNMLHNAVLVRTRHRRRPAPPRRATAR